MATIVLGTVGAVVGGPVGAVIGALAGQQIDAKLFGGGSRHEGPRLEELAITTSSYGRPIGRQHGRMRVAGSIVWATDLVESRETEGGGKGKPKTTSYSYSGSFAVALSSRPIEGVGRIWADGNLLRGTAGDLKTGGILRVHRGHGDQLADPLIAAAEGSDCPAFRNCAYVVFEDLQLADFGNRIPALSFEVLADPGGFDLSALIEPLGGNISAHLPLTGLDGFEYPGGDLRATLAAVDALYPITCRGTGEELVLLAGEAVSPGLRQLPEPAAGRDGDDPGGRAGFELRRSAGLHAQPAAVRYYDIARDYQPGIQRSEGCEATGSPDTVEFPGALTAEEARRLAGQASLRGAWTRDRMLWRLAELDPSLAVGQAVTLPDRTGTWRILNWEWREHAVELELERLPPIAAAQVPADSGRPAAPLDEPLSPSWLRAFELPWDGFGAGDDRPVYVAASATGQNWRGASLYLDDGETLEPIGQAGRTRAIAGTLATPLAPSSSLMLEDFSAAKIDLLAPDMALAPASARALAFGANRLLIGGEIVQFAEAEPLGGPRWLVSGLLRGRAGTEAAAQAGHSVGTAVTLLDERLVTLPPNAASADAGIAAIGLADEQPVLAAIENAGATRKPLCPVHPRYAATEAGGIALRWTRRARGAWFWNDGVDAPLNEEAERYLVGAGPVDHPLLQWEVFTPEIELGPAILATLPSGTMLWVRQIGSFARSDPVQLSILP